MDTEVYSRVCGFYRPVKQWNRGKKEEFKDRIEYVIDGTPVDSSGSGDQEDLQGADELRMPR